MTTEPTDNPKYSRSLNIVNRTVKMLGNVFLGVTILLIVLMIFFLIQNKISGGSPKVAGHHMYIVLSGSMNPAFNTGSVIFVKPMKPEEIKVGDIITFKSLGDSKSLTTHRVVEIDKSQPNNLKFVTRGDANEVNDPYPIPGKNLVGKVRLQIPYLGYFLSFSHSKQGLLVLIIIPGALLMLTELYRLYQNSSRVMKKNGVN